MAWRESIRSPLVAESSPSRLLDGGAGDSAPSIQEAGPGYPDHAGGGREPAWCPFHGRQRVAVSREDAKHRHREQERSHAGCLDPAQLPRKRSHCGSIAEPAAAPFRSSASSRACPGRRKRSVLLLVTAVTRWAILLSCERELPGHCWWE